MKIVKTWKKFNELKSSTYQSAARIAHEYGHNDLSAKFRKHAEFISDLDNLQNAENLMKNINLPEMNFEYEENGSENKKRLIGRLVQIALFDSYQMTLDSIDLENYDEIEYISIPIIYKCQFNSWDSKQGDPSYIIAPFWLEYNNNDIYTSGPHMVDEIDEIKVEEGINPILFNNRKDANLFIKYLKDNYKLLISDLEKSLTKHDMIKDELDNQFFKDFIDKVHYIIHNINPRILYR